MVGFSNIKIGVQACYNQLTMLQLTTVLFLIAGLVLASIHAIAIELSLYWTIWWFDIPMHFLGGSVIALLVFTLHDLRLGVARHFLTLTNVLLVVLLMALAWEVYEYVIGTSVGADFWFDTIVDLIMGLVGGYVGYVVALSVNKLS